MYHPHLDRGLAEYLATQDLTDWSAMTLADIPAIRSRRAARLATVAVPVPDSVRLDELDADGVRLLLYRPGDGGSATDGPLPTVYLIHGGGMILGTADDDRATAVAIVGTLGWAVVSVDYRLAPEHPYPAGVEDCYTGLRHVAENASALGLDPRRIALLGSSAGGGLAAATALLARDRGGPHVAFQMLVCPMLDDRCETFSSRQFGPGWPSWNRDANVLGWTALLGDRRGTDEVPPYAAPARAVDLAGLPPAFVDVPELDAFRDECLEFVRRLAEAGVAVEFHLYPGMLHGFEGHPPVAEMAGQALTLRLAALRRALT